MGPQITGSSSGGGELAAGESDGWRGVVACVSGGSQSLRSRRAIPRRSERKIDIDRTREETRYEKAHAAISKWLLHRLGRGRSQAPGIVERDRRKNAIPARAPRGATQ